MSTVKYDLSITRGFSFKARIQLYGIDDDGVEFPYTLDHRTVTSEARPSANSCKVYPFTITIEDSPEGIFTLSLSTTETQSITEDQLYYDVRITDSNDPTWSYQAVRGVIKVSDYITQV